MTLHHNAAVKADYDMPVDVLYVVKEAVPCEGDGLPDGVELDFALDDGRPSGATIIGFERNGWHDRLSDLVKMLADHLGADERYLQSLIERSLQQR